MPLLRLVAAPSASPPSQPCIRRPFDLAVQPQRPGELSEALVVELDEKTRLYLHQEAHRLRLPPALYLTTAIEGERCLDDAAPLAGGRPELEHLLDRAADPPSDEGLSPADRLADYAQALRAGVTMPAMLVPEAITLTPSSTVAAAWSRTAWAKALSVEDWVREVASTQPASRHLWEASAAEQAQTLAEWVWRHAASA